MDQGKGDRQHHNTQHNIPVSVKANHQNLTTVQDLKYGFKDTLSNYSSSASVKGN